MSRDTTLNQLDLISRRGADRDPQLESLVEEVARELEQVLDGASPPLADEALKACVEALARLSAPGHAVARALCAAAMIFYFSGNAPASRETAKALQGIVPALTDIHVKRSVYQVLALVSADHSTVHQMAGLAFAIGAGSQAIDLARQSGDPLHEASAWIDVGITLVHGGAYGHALDFLEHGIALGRATGSVQVRAHSYLALARLHLGEWESALNDARQVCAETAPPRSMGEVFSLVVAEGACARALVHVGRIEEGEQHAERAWRIAESSRSGRARTLATLAKGLVDIFAGRVSSGDRLLRAACQESRIVLKSLVRESLFCLGEGYEKAEAFDKALAHFDELALELREREHESLLSFVGVEMPRDSGRQHAYARRLREHVSQLRAQVEKERARRKTAQFLERVAVAAEINEDATSEHPYRVGALAALLGEEIGLEPRHCRELDKAARLHDIGKKGVEGVLMKRGSLSPEERLKMQSHTVEGARLLATTGPEDLSMARNIAQHHHERWDGTGYPSGLRGEGIPLEARITAVAEAFDALTHRRPYRAAFSVDEALEMIGKEAGSKFELRITQALARVIPRLRAEGNDLDTYLAQESPSQRNKTVSLALGLRASGVSDL